MALASSRPLHYGALLPPQKILGETYGVVHRDWSPEESGALLGLSSGSGALRGLNSGTRALSGLSTGTGAITVLCLKSEASSRSNMRPTALLGLNGVTGIFSGVHSETASIEATGEASILGMASVAMTREVVRFSGTPTDKIWPTRLKIIVPVDNASGDMTWLQSGARADTGACFRWASTGFGVVGGLERAATSGFDFIAAGELGWWATGRLGQAAAGELTDKRPTGLGQPQPACLSEWWPARLSVEQPANLTSDRLAGSSFALSEQRTAAGLTSPWMAASLTDEQPADMTDDQLTDLTDEL